MKTGFAQFHPLLQMLIFVSCISVTMLIMHPVFLVTSFLLSSAYMICSSGTGRLLSALKLDLITSVMIIIINPLVSHAGVTVLAYLPSGNPLTLESVLFGFAAALLMSCTVNWFFCINSVLTSDRIIYLLGRLFPRLALMISMTLGFSSKLSDHYRRVRDAQKCLCSGNKNVFFRIRQNIRIISSVIQWSLENSVDTADSMKSRGYGTGKRTGYNNYKFRAFEKLLIILIVLIDSAIAAAYFSEYIYFSYYPVLEIETNNIWSYVVFAIYALICLIPLAADLMEAKKWKYLRSGI